MLLILLPTMALAVTMALPSSMSEEDRVIDLQELLLNVSDSYRDFGQGIKDLGSDINSNVKLIIDTVNVNANISNVNAKLMIENINERINDRLNESTEVLKQILEVLMKKDVITTTSSPSTTNIPTPSQDCADLHQKGERSSQPFLITVPSIRESFKVFCDMKTDGGGWTVFQRRGDFGNPKDYFARTWTEYKNGFGDVEKEFWLGNDRISALTHQKVSDLRVELWDLEGNHAHAEYNLFKVDNEEQKYKLSFDGYSGTAGDSMSSHKGMSFTTKDRDNDRWTSDNCANSHGGGGGWWYFSCMHSNLNGLNLRGEENYTGIYWFHWKKTYSMAFTEMKIRPANF